MRGLQKSKRVSWAPDVNLCQVRLFLSEDAPSLVGSTSQDDLQAKSSSAGHANGGGADDFLPPGFEGAHPPNHLQIDVSDIPIIQWRCPPRFHLNPKWRMVAGDESKETDVENQREMRMLEAVYPRPSAIPPNPSVAPDVEASCCNDQLTPDVPITAIEDEELPTDSLSGLAAPFSTSQGPITVPGIVPPTEGSISGVSQPSVSDNSASGAPISVDSHVVAAATAVLTEISKNNGHGGMIDHDLLLKILSNPKLIERLVTEQGSASTIQNAPPQQAFPAGPPSSDHPQSVPLSHPSPLRTNMVETSSPSVAGGFYPQPNATVGMGHHPPTTWSKPPPPAPPSSSPAVSYGASQAKDLNYYKNLIQQHGEERQDAPPHPSHPSQQQYGGRYNQEQANNNGKPSRDSKPKIMKPCIYFNSPRGCRHGANCAYQHDPSRSGELQNAKRMKIDRARGTECKESENG